jgi:myosin heavy subunit
MQKYFKRYIDNELERVTNDDVMVVIDGVKGCGKTEAAKRICKSSIIIDDSEETNHMLQNDPNIILKGEKPRLIDE